MSEPQTQIAEPEAPEGDEDDKEPEEPEPTPSPEPLEGPSMPVEE